MGSTRDLLDRALAKGVISTEQHEQLQQMEHASPAIPSPDERFRIVNGFNEVFISIGLLILMSSVSGILHLMAGNKVLALVLLSAFAWGGAWVFTYRKAALLPAIVCCVYSASYAWNALLYGVLDGKLKTLTAPGTQAWEALLPFVAALAVLLLSVWRFRIPFLMLPIAILFTTMITVAAQLSDYALSLLLVLGFCGVSTLATAIYFDLKDPQRIKRYSDFAFWCYVVGSPLTVHSLFLSLVFRDGWRINESVMLAFAVVAIALVITVMALILNRRAFILSTLLYVTVSINYIIMKLMPGDKQFMLFFTAALIGCYVICLGTVWRALRRALMSRLTPRSWFSKLPAF